MKNTRNVAVEGEGLAPSSDHVSYALYERIRFDRREFRLHTDPQIWPLPPWLSEVAIHVYLPKTARVCNPNRIPSSWEEVTHR